MIKNIITPFNIYTLLWLVVSQNESMKLVPDSVSVAILFIMFAWSLIYFVKVQSDARSIPFIKGLNILFILFTIYGLLRVVGGESIIATLGSGRAIGPREYLIGYWKSLLPIYGFLYFSLKEQISEKLLVTWMIVFIFCSITSYYYEENNRFAMLAEGSLIDGVTNNQSYCFVALMAFLPFLGKKPFIQYSVLVLFLTFIIMGMKRGAILVGALCLILFLLRSFRQAKGTNKALMVLLSVGVFILGFYTIGWYMQNNLYFMMRIEDTISGGSSGRDSIYKLLWDYFNHDMNILQLLFGLGADGTFKAIGQAAHNDWLEVLIDTGLLGLGFYLYYWVQTYKTWRYARITFEDKYHFCITIIFAGLLIKTAFSMSINDILIYTSMPLAYCLSKFIKNNNTYYV